MISINSQRWKLQKPPSPVKNSKKLKLSSPWNANKNKDTMYNESCKGIEFFKTKDSKFLNKRSKLGRILFIGIFINK